MLKNQAKFQRQGWNLRGQQPGLFNKKLKFGQVAKYVDNFFDRRGRTLRLVVGSFIIFSIGTGGRS